MPEFVFMLTHNDRTVPDARAIYQEARETRLRYVGFKDVGLPFAELRSLAAEMRDDGREVMLEVVSERAEDELRSIEAALEVGVDWILGGTHVDDALRVLDGAHVRYCPFPGTVIGHPSLLRGTVESIAASAAELTARPEVAGIDLLAYRYDGDVEALVAGVVAATPKPVIAAGSVDSVARIEALTRLGVWGFTIGGAIIERRLPGSPSVRGQIETVLDAIESAPSPAAEASVQ
jgi:hypothetical protein